MFNVKLAATLVVALMMFSGAAVMVGTEDNDATAWTPNGTGNSYTYVLHYDSSKMGNTAAQELQLSVAGTTPISHTAGTTTLSSVSNEGSWGFDTTTGIGPFNSFYAAFDMTDGNKFVAVLNPYDLTETIDGVDITSSMSNYNIMWVLPTVYWSVDENGDVTLSNDPNNGTAYAHTIDGEVYDYVAYGVYEGSTKSVNDTTVLTSQSGATPTVNLSIQNFRNYAHNYTMSSTLGSNAHSMLWNFYHWELYRLCCYTMMEGFNAQMIVGNGAVNGSSALTTGLTNTLGPYAGNPADLGSGGTNASSYGTDAVKMLIENSWGSKNEILDGARMGNPGLYLDASSNPTDSTTGDFITYIDKTFPSSNWGYTIFTDADIWGIADAARASDTFYNIGTTDFVQLLNNSTGYIVVGGAATSNASASVKSGISYTDIFTSANSSVSSRLLFVYNNPTVTASFAANDDNYGSVSTASIADLEPGTTATILDDTITIGETTITATPAIADAQYTYAFSKWQVSGVDVTGTYTLDADTTFTAVFTATTNQYAVTIAPNNPSYGTVSPTSLTVDYGTAITVDGTSLSIGAQAITATPTTADAQYTYAFSAWSVPDAAETVTGNITITGTFTATVNTYTVTIESADDTLGTVSPTTVSDVPYGTAITVDGDTITIGETTVTATTTEAGDGLVTQWSVSNGATVQGDMTITASFIEPSNAENSLLKLIPFLLVMVLVVTAVGGLVATGGNPESLVRFIIMLAVGVLVVAVFVLPILEGL